MKIFLTGGTGLVGSHTIELLSERGYDVCALVRDRKGRKLVESLGATAVEGVVEDVEAWSHADGADAIVHSAAIITKRGGWEEFRRINVDAARHAALTASNQGMRLVHISSVAVYGNRGAFKGNRIREDAPMNELSSGEFYARSKRGAEEAIAEVVSKTGLSAVSLRPCVIYGERDRTFLPPVIRLLRAGFQPVIGKGTNTLSLVYAGNVAEAVLCALERPTVEGPVNVTNDGDMTQRDFFAKVSSALGRKTLVARVPEGVAYVIAALLGGVRRLSAPRRYSGFGTAAVRFLTRDNPYVSERATTELGWHPTTRPLDALARSVHWFAEGG